MEILERGGGGGGSIETCIEGQGFVEILERGGQLKHV